MGYSRNPASQGKRDLSSAGIVAALKAVGASVTDLGAMGAGVPDLLCGYLGVTLLIEVKSPPNDWTHAKRAKDDALPYAEFLTDDQVTWLSKWRGSRVNIVTTPEEALRVLGLSAEKINTVLEASK